MVLRHSLGSGYVQNRPPTWSRNSVPPLCVIAAVALGRNERRIAYEVVRSNRSGLVVLRARQRSAGALQVTDYRITKSSIVKVRHWSIRRDQRHRSNGSGASSALSEAALASSAGVCRALYVRASVRRARTDYTVCSTTPLLQSEGRSSVRAHVASDGDDVHVVVLGVDVVLKFRGLNNDAFVRRIGGRGYYEDTDRIRYRSAQGRRKLESAIGLDCLARQVGLPHQSACRSRRHGNIYDLVALTLDYCPRKEPWTAVCTRSEKRYRPDGDSPADCRPDSCHATLPLVNPAISTSHFASLPLELGPHCCQPRRPGTRN